MVEINIISNQIEALFVPRPHRFSDELLAKSPFNTQAPEVNLPIHNFIERLNAVVPEAEKQGRITEAQAEAANWRLARDEYVEVFISNELFTDLPESIMSEIRSADTYTALVDAGVKVAAWADERKIWLG